MIIRINYRPHRYQRAFHQSKARFRLFIAGRRGGKTLGAAQEAVKLALTIPGGMGWIVAPTYPMSRVAWRQFLKTLPKPLIRSHNKAERIVELVNGHVVECRSAHKPEDLVGEGLDWLWVDEAARVKREAWEESLRPTLTDKKGRAFFTTTPRGRNWVWELYCRGQDRLQREYENVHFPTSGNPYIDPAEIELARQTLPEMVFRQEYLAEFLDDVNQVFRYVRRQAAGTFEEPRPGCSYVMGADLAKHVDFTVLTVLRVDTGSVVAWDRFNEIDWSLQKQRILSLAQKYRAAVLLDSTGVGDPVFDDLRRSGVRVEGYHFTNESKARIVEHLAMQIEQAKIVYPAIPELLNELEAFEYE
ncbi:MAG: terminase family protein, partial [Firmicutes bacterium]|nr:terminase family protein [Bacillota bacterium]